MIYREYGQTGQKVAADCIECGQCEKACTQHINIIERLREIAK